MARAFQGCREVRRLVSEALFTFVPGSVEVNQNFLPVVLVVAGKHVGAGHAQYFQTVNAGHLLLVAEVGTAEFLEPGEVIEGRVIHTIIAGRTDVGGRHTQMLQEHRVVGTTAEIAHGHIVLHCRRRRAEGVGFLRTGIICTRLARFFPCLVHASALRRRHRLRDLAYKLFQTGHP